MRPKPLLRAALALVNQAALDVVIVVWARPRLGAALVFLACRGLDADAVVLPLPGCFAAGTAAVEGGESMDREEEEEGGE